MKEDDEKTVKEETEHRFKLGEFMGQCLFNRINILLCGVLAGMSIADKDPMAACGWLCACLAWFQSNMNRLWADRMFVAFGKAIDAASLAKMILEDLRNSYEKFKKEKEEGEA